MGKQKSQNYSLDSRLHHRSLQLVSLFCLPLCRPLFHQLASIPFLACQLVPRFTNLEWLSFSWRQSLVWCPSVPLALAPFPCLGFPPPLSSLLQMIPLFPGQPSSTPSPGSEGPLCWEGPFLQLKPFYVHATLCCLTRIFFFSTIAKEAPASLYCGLT